MNDRITESLTSLALILPNDLAMAAAELTTLQIALQREVEICTGVLNIAAMTDPAYTTASNDLRGLLQLMQAAIAGQVELGKLAAAADKAIKRVLKKAPK